MPSPKPDIVRVAKEQEDALRQFRRLGVRPSTVAAMFGERRDALKAFHLSPVQETIRQAMAPTTVATSTLLAEMTRVHEETIKSFQLAPVRVMQETIRQAMAPTTVATSTLLAEMTRVQEQTIKSFQLAPVRVMQETIQQAMAPSVATSTLLAEMTRVQEQTIESFQLAPVREMQEAIRRATAPWGASAERLADQVRAIVGSPLSDVIGTEFARLRAEIELATGPLPPLVAVAEIDVAVDVGLSDARTLRERWNDLPDQKRAELEVSLMALVAALGTVITDFVPNEHATRVCHIIALMAAIHAVLSWRRNSS